MSWFSLLPPELSVYEVWLIRIFMLLGLCTVGPWLTLIVYDFLLYLVRTLYYELPVVGGRASGQRRPRAPSLSERPDGHRRHFSLGALPVSNTFTEDESVASSIKDKNTSPKAQTRHRQRVLFEKF